MESMGVRPAAPLGALLRGSWPHSQDTERALCLAGYGGAASSSGPPMEAFSQRAAMQRMPSTASNPTGLEADCPGPWLRTWVEFQVDARINQALRDLAEGELFTAGRQDGERALEMAAEAIHSCQRMEDEMNTILQAQAHVLTGIDSLTARIDNMSKSMPIGGIEDSLLAKKVEYLEARLEAYRDESQRLHQIRENSEHPTLQEAHARMESRLERLEHDVASVTKARAVLHNRFEELRTDLASAVVTREDLAQGIQELANDVTEALASTKQELLQVRAGDTLQAHQTVEAHIANSSSADKVKNQNCVRWDLDSPELQIHVDKLIREKLEVYLQKVPQQHKAEIEGIVDEKQRSMMEKVDAWQRLLDKEVEDQFKQLASDLQSKIDDGESSAVVNLEEKLWRSEQKLGQRVDALHESLAVMRSHNESEAEKPQHSPPPQPAPEREAKKVADEMPSLRMRARLGPAAGRRHTVATMFQPSLGAERTSEVAASQDSRTEGPSSSPDHMKLESLPHAEEAAADHPVRMPKSSSTGSIRQMARTAPGLRISDALATATQALAEDESRRQLQRLTQLERLQEQSSKYRSNSASDPSPSTSRQAHEDTWKQEPSSPSSPLGGNPSSVVVKAAARASRRMGPFARASLDVSSPAK